MLDRRATRLTLLTLAAPAALAAQGDDAQPSRRPTLTADLLGASGYVWRGVTNVNRPVLDPSLTLGVPVRGATLSVGAWGNLESRRYVGPTDLNTYGGVRGPAVSMSQFWVEARHPLGGLFDGGALTIGATEYHYPNVGDLARDYETAEGYAILAAGGPLAPSLSVWVDAMKVRGAYGEAAVSHAAAVPHALPRWLGAGRPLNLAAVVGYSAGMGEREGQSAYFAGDGVTHADLSASSEVPLGGALTLLPTVHVLFGRDAHVRVVAPDVSRGAKLWVGASLHWSGHVPAVRHATRPAYPGARSVRPFLLPAIVASADTTGSDPR